MRLCQGPPPRRSAARLIILTFCLALLMGALPVRPLAPVAGAAPADELGEALARVNAARAAIGVAPLNRHPALDKAATAHANYYKANFGDPALAGMGLHYEEAGKPGFTGTDFAARAKAQGYSGSINENVGLSGSMLVSVDWFMATVNHRLTLLDPRYTDIGLGAVNEGRIKMEVIDLGTIVFRQTVEPAWTPWPAPNATGVGLRFDGETPNPFPGATYPVGYPITLKYNGKGAVAFASGKITQGGQAVPTFTKVGTGFITKNTFIVSANKPLLPGTTYTVTIEGTLDGQPFTRGWDFTTQGAAPPATLPAPPAPLPPGVARADPMVAARWKAADYDIARGAASRTWTWGPDVLSTREEQYDEAKGGARTVYYFDKSRMEINDPGGDRTSPWFVTNGLLVRELIGGRVQVGNDNHLPVAPAAVTLAGDPAERNPTAATYASLAGVASLEPGANAAPRRDGQAITATIDAAGAMGDSLQLAGAAKYGAYDPTLGHNIADVFYRWLTAQPVDWVYAAGYPLTEPYWTQTKINGADTWVLVQAFERRILTFVPGNAAAWQVEAGNVGYHYYEWRYGAPPE